MKKKGGTGLNLSDAAKAMRSAFFLPKHDCFPENSAKDLESISQLTLPRVTAPLRPEVTLQASTPSGITSAKGNLHA